jgi:hypothetical protein
MVKRKRTRDKERQRGTQPKFTNRANVYYKEVIAPLERACKRAIVSEQYKEVETLFLQIRKAKKDHRQLLMRKEFVRIK